MEKLKSKYNYGRILLVMLMSLFFIAVPWITSATAQIPESPPRVFLDSRQLMFEVAPIIENSRTLVPLRTIFESMGAQVDWNASTRVITAKKGDTTVILPINSRTAMINGSACTLEVPPKIVDSRTLAPLRFVAEAFGGKVTWDGNTRTIYINSSEFPGPPPEPQPQETIVVLDAGHGGSDPGALGAKLKEKDINLAITLKVGDLLQQAGIRVEYTRIDDSYVGLQERSSIANKINASIFVSIHNNANVLSGPSGTETYFYAPQDSPELFAQREERARLAQCIQAELVSKLRRPNRGVKEGNLSVLRNTLMPSVLVEAAFISNPTEEALLQTEDFKNRAAEAIANGIRLYINK